MRILALETSTRRGSLALLDQTATVSELTLPETCRTAQALAPAMHALFEQAGWTPSSIQLVALAGGPGSFTGLRIAVTAAKTFAYAARADLVAVNTLEVLVHQLPACVEHACALMDAQRQQFFVAIFRRGPDRTWCTVEECQILRRDEISDRLRPGTMLTGPVLAKSAPPLLDAFPRSDPSCWLPRASTVGQLARQAYECGHRDDLWALRPRYYRPSYAEEKRKKQHNRGDGI